LAADLEHRRTDYFNTFIISNKVALFRHSYLIKGYEHGWLVDIEEGTVQRVQVTIISL
jgi:hypothetical protein